MLPWSLYHSMSVVSYLSHLLQTCFVGRLRTEVNPPSSFYNLGVVFSLQPRHKTGCLVTLSGVNSNPGRWSEQLYGWAQTQSAAWEITVGHGVLRLAPSASERVAVLVSSRYVWQNGLGRFDTNDCLARNVAASCYPLMYFRRRGWWPLFCELYCRRLIVKTKGHCCDQGALEVLIVHGW